MLTGIKRKDGFTLVEIIIATLILAIVLAIAIPVMLSVLDSSNNVEVAEDAKSIWNAVQTACNDQLANDEHWYNDTDDIGIILNETHWAKYQDIIKAMQGLFLYMGNKAMAKKISSKIECFGKLEALYFGTGRYAKYFRSDDYDLSYKVFLIAFKYKDNKTLYFYDGKEIFETWPFSNPKENKNVDLTKGNLKILTRDGKTELQFYSIINNSDIANKFRDLYFAK